MITRRLFLKAVPPVALAVNIPAVASAKTLEITQQQRLDAAIEELKAASEVIWPNANDWRIIIGASPGAPLLVNALTPTHREMQSGPLIWKAQS
ncbi:hypothetical protein [Phyllobacterium sp. SB3]|uniref:hypothetical protein n=1 Tax=Phyllobacterium sp. SB3 TaxID=3156073 RepID=UPI0032AF208E